MSVTLVTAGDAARHPSHPDHARWVKERTLAMEIEHAQANGGTLRDAENANRAALGRLSARQGSKPAPVARRAEREVTKAKLAEAGVTKRPARVVPVMPMVCRMCGLCIECKRLARLAEIRRRERLGDENMEPFINALRMTAFAHGLRRKLRDEGAIFPFDSPSESVRLRAYNAMVDRVCDRTVPLVGAWR